MTTPYPVRALTPAHPYLANAAGIPAQLANAKYVESLARIVCYWGYPAVDTFTTCCRRARMGATTSAP